MTTPVLKALRVACPDGRLGCMAHPKRMDVLRGLPYLDLLAGITPKRATFMGHFQRRSWDYAFVYGKDRSLFRFASRIAHRVVGFHHQDGAVKELLCTAVAPATELVHAVDDRLELVRAVRVQAEDLRLDYRVLPEERAWAGQWLEHHGLAGKRLVGFQVSSFPTKAYRDWPLGHFKDLAARLLTAHSDLRILVLGDAASGDKARQLAAEFPGKLISCAGQFSLRQSGAIMARLALYVGVDTGPTHMAGALGIPMVALYHCFHRGRYLAPLQHERLRVIEHPASDADCTRTTEMGQTGVDAVWSAAEDLLSDSAV